MSDNTSRYSTGLFMLIDGKLCKWKPQLARYRSVPAMQLIADHPIPICTFRWRGNARKFSQVSERMVGVPYTEVEITRA